jgi:hypothetical protein
MLTRPFDRTDHWNPYKHIHSTISKVFNRMQHDHDIRIARLIKVIVRPATVRHRPWPCVPRHRSLTVGSNADRHACRSRGDLLSLPSATTRSSIVSTHSVYIHTLRHHVQVGHHSRRKASCPAHIIGCPSSPTRSLSIRLERPSRRKQLVYRRRNCNRRGG